MDLVPVSSHAVFAAWPRVSPWIKAACERPGCDLTPDALRELCIDRKAQLITIHDEHGRTIAAGVTQVRDHESGARSCWVLAIGGTGAKLWLGTLDLIEAGALRNGCTRVEFEGRAGWAALLPGYETTTHYRKELRA